MISKFTGRQLHVNLPLHLALLSGVLPDFDIYFQPYVKHHTITHSLLLLLPLTILLSYRYRLLGVAFSTGLLSHLLTDSLVGEVPILWPVSSMTIGLNLGIPGPADTFLETGALAAAFLYALQNGDRQLFTRPGRNSLPTAIPLTAIVSLSLLFLGDNKISLATLAFSRRALTLITIGHAALVTILLLGTIQGLRAHLPQPNTTTHNPK